MSVGDDNLSASRAEAVALRVLAGLLIAAVLFTGSHVTYRVEIFRGATVMVLAAALVGVGLIVPMLRGRRFAVHRAAWLGLALVGWMAAGQLIGNEAGYYGPYQLAKLITVGALVLLLAARADALPVGFCLRALAAGLIALGGFALCGYVLGWQVRGMSFVQPLTLSFANANFLGATIAMAGLAVAGLALLVGAAGPWRWVCAVAVVVAAVLVIGTQSRNAIGVGGVGGAMILLVAGRAVARLPWWKLGLAVALFAGLGIAAAFLGTNERFHEKVRDMGHVLSRSDVTRWYYYRIVLDHAADDPGQLIAGSGFSSFSRFQHGVDPRPFGYFTSRIDTHYAHSEYFEWLHDGGIVGLGLLLATFSLTLIHLVRRARSDAVAIEQRRTAAALAVPLVAWLLLGLFSVAPRYIGPQVMLAFVIGLSWRAPAAKAANLRGRWPALALAAGLGWSLYTAFTYFMSERAFVQSHDAQAFEPARPDRAAAMAERAVAWRPDNAPAHYQLLQLALARADHAGVEAEFRALSRLAPHYSDIDAAYAHSLAMQGRFADAAGALQAYQRVAPYDYARLVALPDYGLLAGDGPLLGRSLLVMLNDAVHHLNHLDRTSHRPALIDRAGRLTLRVAVDGSTQVLTLDQDQAPGVILGRTPKTSTESRHLVAQGINRFLRAYLYAREDLVPEALFPSDQPSDEAEATDQ